MEKSPSQWKTLTSGKLNTLERPNHRLLIAIITVVGIRSLITHKKVKNRKSTASNSKTSIKDVSCLMCVFLLSVLSGCVHVFMVFSVQVSFGGEWMLCSKSTRSEQKIVYQPCGVRRSGGAGGRISGVFSGKGNRIGCGLSFGWVAGRTGGSMTLLNIRYLLVSGINLAFCSMVIGISPPVQRI